MNIAPTRFNALLSCLLLPVCCLQVGIASSALAQGLPVVFAKNAIAANSVIAADDLELQLNAPNSIPVDSFGSFEQIAGQIAKVDIPAGGLVTRAMVSLPQRMSVSRDENIYSIPVSVRSEFKVGDRVKIVVSKDGKEEVILENVMVFHMGPPETDVVDENGDPLFVRYVSVVVGATQAAEALPKLRVKNKAFTLIPVQSFEDGSSTRGESVANKATLEKPQAQSDTPQLPDGSSTQVLPDLLRRVPPGSSNLPMFEPSVPMKDAGLDFDFSDLPFAQQQVRLRGAARSLDRQASELEDRSAYEKADLLRDAAQSLREAARIRGR